MANEKPLKGGAATFIKGKPYTREYFGIDKNNAYSTHIIRGKFCLFLNMYGDFNNEEQEDGFIFQPRYEYELVPEGTKQPAVVSIFIREEQTTEYDYRGDSYAMIRYDENRNKLLWS